MMDLRRITNCALWCVAVVSMAAAVQAETIYVDDDNCPGPGDGSEANPYCSIQTAIDNGVDTDEIVVSPGTYFETINFVGKAVTLRSSDGPAVTTIDGGGGIHVVQCVSGEGPGTVLDGFTITGGDASGSGSDSRGGGMYNHSSSPAVTNCTFIGNVAVRGGGMGTWLGSPTVTDCTFSANSASSGGGMGGLFSSPTVINCMFDGNVALTDGGGMGNWYSSPTVTGCTFSDNRATDADSTGGGMFNFDDANAVVTDCTFVGNSATLGGGMYNGTSSPTVTSCLFVTNDAYDGGGMYNYFGDPTVTSCLFTENYTSAKGGGMYNENSSPIVTECQFVGHVRGGMYNWEHCNPTVTNCAFIGNHATSGGGISIWNESSPTVANCSFIANSATSGGGIRLINDSSAVVANCAFVANHATAGGAISSLNGSSLTVTNCTFSGNNATGAGGVNTNNESDTSLANCILWGNAPDEIRNGYDCITTAQFCDIRGYWPGIGNINADPMFIRDPNPGPDDEWGTEDDDYGDVRLEAASPCIDAADNTAVPPDTLTDLDGNPRFLEIPETPDTGFGDPPIVDMGAYESLGGGCLAITNIETVCHGDSSTFTVNVEGLNACTGGTTMVTFTGAGGAVGEDFCATMIVNTEQGGFCCSTQVCVPVPDCSGSALPCDLDGDGVVGVMDFLALLTAWGPNPGHPADFDGDGEVGVADFLLLLANWD
jgi:hypothetical protein